MLSKVIRGMIESGEIVMSTMGPFGKRVILETRNPQQSLDRFSRDGVTVADAAQNIFSCPYKNIGSRLMVDAAKRTVDTAGDGTSSTCAMAVAGLLAYKPEEMTYNTVRDLQAMRDLALEVIENEIAFKPDWGKFLDAVTVSANNLEAIGKSVAELVYELGDNAYIRPYPHLGKETTARVEDGYHLTSGAFVPHFINCPDLPNVQKTGHSVILKNPYVAIIEEDIERNQDLIPFYTAYRKATGGRYDRPFVIVAGQVQEPAIRFVLQNMFEGDEHGRKVPVFVIKSPEVGQKRFHILEDVSSAVNTRKVFSKYNGTAITSFKGHSDFGEAQMIEISHTTTRILPPAYNGIDDRVAAVKADLKLAEEQVSKGEQAVFDPEFLKSRIAALTSGVGLIAVGGHTKAEQGYNFQVIDDAVSAAKVILREGVVPGSGATYLRCIPAYEFDPLAKKIFTSMMQAPRVQVCANANIEFQPTTDVYNVVTNEHEKAEETTILDPATVAKQVIINSVSLVSEVIQSKHVIVYG